MKSDSSWILAISMTLIMTFATATVTPITPAPSFPYTVDGGLSLDPVHHCIAAGHLSNEAVSILCPNAPGQLDNFTIHDEIMVNMTEIGLSDSWVLDGFGQEVCIYDDYLLVGAPGTHPNWPSFRLGLVFMFTRLGSPGSPWSYNGTLSYNAQNDARAGSALACGKDWYFVGAPGNEEFGVNSGTVHVFQVGNLVSVQELTPASRSSNYYFGDSLAMFEDVVAVGEPGFSNTGRVSVFNLIGGTWVRRGAPGGISTGFFGTSVSTSQSLVIGGNSAASFGGSTYVGEVEVLRGDPPGSFAITGSPIRPPTTYTSMNFGTQVGIVTDDVIEEWVAGASDTSNPGRVYLFSDLGYGDYSSLGQVYQGYWISTDVGLPFSPSFGRIIRSVPGVGFVAAASDLSSVALFVSDCGLGSWLNTTSGLCSACPFGTTSSPPNNEGIDAASACDPCPPGYIGFAEGICTACLAGTRPANSTTCIACEDGTTSGSGDADCQDCLPGSYGENSFCELCPVGTFSNITGGAGVGTCSPCDPGQTSPGGSRFNGDCVPCINGEYEQGGECFPCPAGTWSSTPGRGLSTCSSCPPGTVSSLPGLTHPDDCNNCSLNAIPNSAQDGCDPCAEGFSNPGDEVCTVCVEPETQIGNSCELCPENTEPQAGTGCVDCLYLSGATAGSSSCSICPAGAVANSPPELGCSNCPDGYAIPWQLGNDFRALENCDACGGEYVYYLTKQVMGDVEERVCLDCSSLGLNCLQEGETPLDAKCVKCTATQQISGILSNPIWIGGALAVFGAIMLARSRQQPQQQQVIPAGSPSTAQKSPASV